ncbi:hypothetical protein SAE01_26650 [Segetibacter aerophilus]|uniref:Uncharacterized protein n=1 Tax=Segetibacter aerophilus TaxID=670293 RepID=A0A512BDZ1_9BACT|nr:hypothetical protein SAE01_26650 [Segetibacter aerophilus]
MIFTYKSCDHGMRKKIIPIYYLIIAFRMRYDIVEAAVYKLELENSPETWSISTGPIVQARRLIRLLSGLKDSL